MSWSIFSRCFFPLFLDYSLSHCLQQYPYCLNLTFELAMESQIDSYRARWWAVARTRPEKSFVKPCNENKNLAFRPHISACSTCAIWSCILWPSQLSAFLCGSYRKTYPRYGSWKPWRMFSHHVSRARHRTSIYTCFEIVAIRRNYYFWMHRTLSLIISSDEIFVVEGSIGGYVQAGMCWQISYSVWNYLETTCRHYVGEPRICEEAWDVIQVAQVQTRSESADFCLQRWMSFLYLQGQM